MALAADADVAVRAATFATEIFRPATETMVAVLVRETALSLTVGIRWNADAVGGTADLEKDPGGAVVLIDLGCAPSFAADLVSVTGRAAFAAVILVLIEFARCPARPGAAEFAFLADVLLLAAVLVVRKVGRVFQAASAASDRPRGTPAFAVPADPTRVIAAGSTLVAGFPREGAGGRADAARRDPGRPLWTSTFATLTGRAAAITAVGIFGTTFAGTRAGDVLSRRRLLRWWRFLGRRG
jgi:hypothetical protein